jgi:hypothetical protein
MTNPLNYTIPLYPIRTVTANDTATVTDHTILVDATAGPVTIGLPPAAGMAGRMMIVKKIDATSNSVTTDPNASETSDGALTQVVTERYGTMQYHCDGTAWWALSKPASAFGFPYTVDPGFVRSTDARAAPSTNGAIYARVLGGGPVSKIGLQCQVSSGNISVGVHQNSGVGRAAVPGARIATSGAVACPAVGYAEVSLGGSVPVAPGDWFSISADNVTASFLCNLGVAVDSSIGLGRQFRQATAHPVPATPSGLLAAVGYSIVMVGVP